VTRLPSRARHDAQLFDQIRRVWDENFSVLTPAGPELTTRFIPRQLVGADRILTHPAD
jgi:hypothetical protein